jgi:hypothetical protein
VLELLREIVVKNDLENGILLTFMSEIKSSSLDLGQREVLLQDHEKTKKLFRLEHTMESLSERARAETGNAISSRKIRDWYHDYLENQSFEEDLRGSWKRDMFLEDYDYALRFQIYLKNERKPTVDTATKELESMILKHPPKTEEGKKAFDSLRPFSRRTVHRWMVKLGCKYEKATVSYYTDSHEAEETKRDMKERYSCFFLLCFQFRSLSLIYFSIGPAQLRFAVRLPVWFEVPLSKSTEAALKNRADILRAADISPIISTTEEISDPIVRIHCDYLDEAKHEEYRKHMMTTHGRPGEYFYDIGNPGWSRFRCHHRHDENACKCKLPLYHIGQHEAVFKQFALPLWARMVGKGK